MFSESLLWQRFAQSNKNRGHIDYWIGRYKSKEFIALVKRWSVNIREKRVLKTDLREEAFGEDEILFSLPEKGRIYGLDIAEEVTKSAYYRQREKGFAHKYVTADVKKLPFVSNCFDTVLSVSTLDHFFKKSSLEESLLELKRVTKLGGKMLITINNKSNFIFYFFLKIKKMLGLQPYPVQFYSLAGFKKIVQKAGWYVLNEDFSVHIISPMNTFLLLLRRFIDGNFVDRIAKKCITMAKWLGKRKTKAFTGWFIVLKCVKK